MPTRPTGPSWPPTITDNLVPKALVRPIIIRCGGRSMSESHGKVFLALRTEIEVRLAISLLSGKNTDMSLKS